MQGTFYQFARKAARRNYEAYPCCGRRKTHLRVVQSELEDEGYNVTVANSGAEALRAVEGNPPDLIVLDVQMPGMDGIETLEKLLGRDQGIPIILNTAYSHYREDFTTWGADAYVVKSSDTTKLKREIKRLLGNE